MLESAPKRSILQHPGSVSNLLQALLDGMIILGLFYFLVDRHIGGMTYEYTILLLLLIGVIGIAYDQMGIYRKHSSATRKALDLFEAWTLGFAFLMALGFLTKQGTEYSRLLMGELYVAGYLAQLLSHFLVGMVTLRLLKRPKDIENAIIVGSGQLANYLYHHVSGNPWLGQRILGNVVFDASPPAPQADDDPPPLLGTTNDLLPLLHERNIRTVYFVTPLEGSDILEALYFSLLDRHVAIHWIPDIFSLRLVNHSVRELAGLPVLTLSETPLVGTRLLLKSIEDKVLGTLLLLAVSPILLAVAIAIKLDDPGPVFFRQQRLGWNGKPFRIWKFRSMVVHQPEDNVIRQATKNDPRVTRVGAFIRRTSLDELPQLFNVLMGEMSLVGPRPHAVQHDQQYSRRIGDYFARHNIKPGITGLAQVRGLRGETKDIKRMMQRVESDIEYINNWSLWLDLSILLRTFLVFTGRNAY
jgi:putative colanic acid biosynthesis UDP-glucose lipid carrier transferase